MKSSFITSRFIKIANGLILPTFLIACDPVAITPEKSGSHLARSEPSVPISPIGTDPSRKGPRSEDPQSMSLMAKREVALSSAMTFFSAYWNEIPNPYFTKEYPPEVIYDAASERFYVIFETENVDSQIHIVIDKAAKRGNIILENGLSLSDPPTKDAMRENCQLFDINNFRRLIRKYFINRELKR